MKIDKWVEKLSLGGTVACFGSRETPQSVLALMERLGKAITSLGGYVSSGHAQGADLAFEMGGCQGNPRRVIVSLPWPTYNKNIPIHDDAKVCVLTEQPFKDEFLSEAAKYHGAWDRCSQGAKLLHARNMLIVDGAFMGIGYLNHKKPGGGGSGQAYRVLTETNRPVSDLAKVEVAVKWDRLLKNLGY